MTENEESMKNSVWLLQWIRNRIKKNRNLIALFIGDTGSGKSMSAIRLAERVDPNFSVDRIVFTVQDFLELVNSGLPAGSVIVFDDAGLGINARLWQEMSARVFGMLTQGFRYKQILTFITVPDETFIERQSRRLVHIRFEATDVQGLMKMKLLSRNTFDPEHPMAKFPRIHRGISEIIVKMVKFRLPSDDLREKYEAKKKEYMEKRFKKFQEELNLLDGGQISLKNGKTAVHLKCDECGYEWDYTGHDRRPQCRYCGHGIYIADIEGNKKSAPILKCRHCGYQWPYTGENTRTLCPNPKCRQHVDVIKDKVGAKDDPFDPLNTPYRPGMTRDEIFDLMVEKMIRKGEKITPEIKKLMEKLAEGAAKLGEKKYGKEGGENKDDGDKK
jgi:DNA-directed RNA polymerase subunit RPC12/RpoP/adenylate kinase family enzyme